MTLKIYNHAAVRFSDDDTATLSALMVESDSDGSIIVEPPEFPLHGAKVVFSGNQAVISIPDAGRRSRRVCRLTDASITDSKREGDPVVIAGTCAQLTDLGLTAEDSHITAIVESYASCSTC